MRIVLGSRGHQTLAVLMRAIALAALVALPTPPIVVAADGPSMVRDIKDPGTSDPQHLLAVGNTLFFVAGDERGRELWKSDGTLAGTVIVKDIWPGAEGSEPYAFIAVGTWLYFAANDGSHGFELWRSDGTSGGTRLVADISPGMESSYPSRVTEVAGRLYFFRKQPRVELWTSDGTANGTRFVELLSSEYPNWPRPVDMFAFGSRFWFTASRGPELLERQWVSDGTARGTKPFLGRGSLLNFGAPVHVGDLWYFPGTDSAHGTELWRSIDGTLRTAELVADTDPRWSSHCGCPLSGAPRNIVGGANGLVFFSAGYTGSQTADGEENVRAVGEQRNNTRNA